MSQPNFPVGMFGQDDRIFDLVGRGLPDREIAEAANKLNFIRYRKLSTKQRIFVDYYLETGFNEALSARQAGFVDRDSTDEEARRAARSVLRIGVVREAIEAAYEYYQRTRAIKLDPIVDEIKAIAFANIADFFVPDEDGNPVLRMPDPNDPASRALLASISEITVSTTKIGGGKNAQEIVNTKFKMHSKLTALEQLLKIANVKGIVSGAQAAADAVNTTNNLNITTVNILPVPSGHFFKDENEVKTIEMQAVSGGFKMLPSPANPQTEKRVASNSAR